MKYLKTYENLSKPQIGDYVIINLESFNDLWKEQLENNIGKIIKLSNSEEYSMFYNTTQTTKSTVFEVEFEYYLPNSSRIGIIEEPDIIYWSSNKNDVIDTLKSIMQSKKFNL